MNGRTVDGGTPSTSWRWPRAPRPACRVQTSRPGCNALRRAAAEGDAETAVRLGGALWRFWLARGYADEGMRSLHEALAHAERATPSTRAKAFNAAGKLA